MKKAGSASVADKLKKAVEVFLQKMMLSLNLFGRNELTNQAGAAAYYFLLSTTPVVLLIIFIFDRYMTIYPGFSDSFFLFLSRINENINKDLLQRLGLLNIEIGAFGIFGIANIVLASRLILTSIQRTFHIIFPGQKIRTPLIMNIFSFLFLPVILIIATLSVFLTSGLNLIVFLNTGNVIFQRFISGFMSGFSQVWPFFFAFFIIFFTYRYIPTDRPKIGSAFSGTILCTFSFFLLQRVFSLFFKATRYNLIYGFFGTLIVLLVWVYFIFLFYYLFAEFTYVSDRIDVLLIERMYNMHRRRSEKGKKIENFLFQKPRLLLEKYAKQFERGATIFEEGSSGKDVFFIFNGRVRVEKTVRRRVEVLNSLGEGEFFGEMAYLLGEKRTARVVAEEGSLILVIKSRIFEELIRTDTTVAHDVIHSLCNRLKGSIEK